MPLDRNKLKQLYSTLQKGGYSQSYDQFENGFTGNNNYANRKKVYDLLTANGAQIGNSYEDFMKRIYTPGATPQRQAPPQQRRAAAPAKSNNGGSGFQFDPNFGKQSQETFFNGGRQTHVGGKYDPIEAGRRQYRASQANNPTVKRQAAQGNPHAKKAVEQGVKAQKEIEGEEAQSRQRRTGQTPQQQARVDASLQIDPEKASKRIQQKMDEAAYMAETGKELKNPVEIGTKIGENGEVIGDPLIAPTLAREENGNIQRGANGEPLIGASSDAERTNAYKQTLVERQKPTIDERINEAEEERERLEEQLKKRGAELDAQNEGSVWRDLPRGGGAGVHTINSTDVNGRNTDTEYLDLLAAQKKVDEQLRDLKAARDEKTGTFLGGAWRGFRDYAFDLSNWDGGYRDLLTSSAMLRSKYGVPKTKREKAAERSMMENTYKADNAAQEAEDALGNGYRFMRIGAQSLPFALNFMAGNLTGITSGIARAGEALGVKAARNIAIKQGANNILRNLGRSVLRNTGVMLGDLGASTALTTTMQAGQTASDIFNRHVGNVTYDPKTDDYNLENGKSLGRSIYEGVANSTIENYTEMLGEHMHFGKFAKWGLNKIGLGKVSDWFTKVCKTDFMQGVNKYLEMGGFNGYPQEVAEEEVGIPLHAIFDGGNQFSDLKDKRQQLDIVGGMLFSMAGMGAGSLALNAGGKVAHKAGMAIQYQQDQHNLNNADKVASFRLTDEKWQPLKEKIDDTTNDDFGKVMSGILSDKSLAPQEKSAVWDYAQRMLIMRGHNMGQVAATKNGMTDQATNASNESFEAGYNAGSEDLNRIKAAYDNARSQAEQTFSPEDLKKIDDDPVSYLRDLGDGEGSQYTRQAVMEYSNAKTAYDGMIQRAKDDLDSKLQDVNMTIDSHVQSADNGGDGMIHPITMKGQNDNGTDKKAYIISGNVVMTDDGTMVDDKKSSPSIIIRNEDGSIEMTSPDRILSVDEPLDPETERKQAVESVQQQFAQERANEIDGTLGFAEGDNYQVIGSDNAEHSVNVIQDNGDGTVTAVWDGHTDQPVQLSKDDVQQMSDAYRLQQYSQEQEEANQEEKEAESQEQQPDEQEAEDELPAGTPRETISYEPDMEMKPEVGNSVYVTDKDGNMVHGEVTQTDDLEGKYLVRTDKKVNGKLVQPFNQEEILYEVHRMKPQEEESPQIIDSGENGGESGGVNGGENTDEEQKPQRAIDLIPSQEVDDGKGNVRTVHQWEQAEPGNTYDALTEIYHGNADRVKKGIDNRVGKIDKAIKGVQKKMDAIDNSDDFDEVAAQSDQYDQLQQQKDALEQQKKYWQSVSRVPQSRKMEADRRTAEEKAAAKAAQEKAEAEAAEKARQEREQVNGVPDVVNDIPADARKRGFRNVNGMVVSRQGETQGVTGRESNVKFSSTDTAKGHIKVIDADELQPSHVSGQRNPAFFIDEAQPKDRTDTVSSMAAAKIASNLNPEEITGDGSAYQFSAPTVNSRGEVIQGNNRSDALKLMYSSAAFKPAQDAYKQYIADHAEEFGFTPEDVAKIQQMEHPVMVNELDVPDDEAIRLGQMRASDNESGGIERIDPVTTSQKLGTKVSNFASVLLSSPDEDAPLSDVLMQNGAKAVKWLQSQGAISDTAAQSAFDKKGNLTPEVRMDLQNILKQSLFQGGVSDLSTMFDKMPAKAQKAILSTFMRDFDSAESERILPEIQKAIEAWYGCAMANDAFAKASNYKAAKAAMHDWTLQTNLLDDNMPSDKFSNFAMELACRLQGCTMRETQQNLNDFFDLVQGKSQGDLFGGTTMGEQADRQESIRRIFNIEYKPISNNNGKGTSNNVADNSSQSREGRQGSKADSSGRERAEGGEQPAASAGGTEKADEQKAEITHVDTRGHGSRTYIKEGGKTTIIFGEGNKVQYHGGEYTVGKRNDDGTYELINGTNVQAFSNAKTEEIKPAETAAQPIGNTSSSEKVEAERQGVNTEPSEKQKEAGNYKKGHIKVDGYDITIENPKGSVREKKDANGKVLWRTPMHYDYGYILGTKGTDGDHIDVYLSDIPTSGNVYVVDQIDQKTGKFDEHKVMYGFPSKEAAIDAYKSQYEKGWKVGTVTEVSREDFKKWVDSSKRKTKPFSEYKSVKTVEEPQSVGTGDFGPIYDQFKGKPKEAINFLLKKKDGEAIGALHHKDIGDIDLVWGKEGTGHSDGYGLAKLAKFHPEVLDNLQDILDDMHVTKRTENRVQLESDTHQATVRLTWNDKKKTWLLTAFEKKNSALDNTTDTAKTSDIGKRNDTATPQSTVSEGKDKQSSSKKQEKGEKNNQGQFGLVSDKRMEELKKRLRDKLNNLNMGVDPEVIAIGLELTTGYIDRGIKKFADYAKVMINDLGEVVRPYLKAFYNGVREMPEITSNGLDKEVDDYDTVSKFNVATIGNEGNDVHPSILDTAEQVSNESHVEKEAQKVSDDDVEKEREKGKMEMHEVDTDKLFNDLKAGKSAKLSDYYKDKEVDAAQQRPTDSIEARPAQGTATTTDEGLVRTHERTSLQSGEKGDVKQMKAGGGVVSVSKREAALRDAVMDLEREAGLDVIDDVEEGQRVLDMVNGEAKLMGSRTNKKMANIGEALEGRELTERQQKVVDVFRGKSDNTPIEVERADGKVRVIMRQGNDEKAGTKHSLYGHYGTNKGVITDEDILIIPDVLARGERTPKMRGNTQLYEYTLNGENGTRYTVLTEKKHSREEFADFYTNKKTSQSARKTRSEEARDIDNNDVSSAKLQQNSDTFKEMSGKIREQRVYHGSAADFDAFDTMNHLSEGEGNQAFGAGTYVADQKDLGMKYANIAYDNDHNKQIAHWNGERLIKRFPTVEDFLNNPKTQEAMAKNGKTEAELRAYYDKQQKNAEAPRILYTVEIPDDNGKNYLDWDGELTRKQADTIRKKLYDAVLARNDDYKGSEEYLAQDLSVIKYGSHIGDTYGTISDYLGSGKAASEFLHDLGYTGFKMHAAHNSSDKRYKNNWNYVIFNDKDLKIKDKVRFFRTADGDAYGYTVGGKIYIDPRIATSETPIHEYAHLWAEALRKANPKEWQNVVELMKECKSVWEQVKKEYPELRTDDEIADEVLAHYSGRRGAERLRQEAAKAAEDAKGVLDKASVVNGFGRLREAIKKAWKHIAEDILHIHFTSADEVADKMMYDLLNKVKPGAHDQLAEERAEIERRAKEDGEAQNEDSSDEKDEDVLYRDSEEDNDNMRSVASDNDDKLRVTTLPLNMRLPVNSYSGEATTLQAANAIQNLGPTVFTLDGYELSVSRKTKKKLSNQLSQNANKGYYKIALEHLPEIIGNSVLVEEHRDRTKVNGERTPESPSDQNIDRTQRFYGAVNINGKSYRVKTTAVVLKQGNNRMHSYEVTKMELLISTPTENSQEAASSSNSITLANLLQNVEFSYEKGRKILDEMQNNADVSDNDILYRVEDDPEELKKLEMEPKVKVYRAMQLIDGKLYPPMAAKVNGSLVEPAEPGQWLRADEHPELAKNGLFTLNKGGKDASGKRLGSVPAAYNPYWHTSRSPLNDQFSSAYKRPNLVTVEVEIPKSELTSGYHADGAKDPVGEMSWHAGPVSSKLPKEKERKVILSRWCKVVRVVPDAEVADKVAGMLKGENISVPDNTVTPSLRMELEKRGVPITHTKMVEDWERKYPSTQSGLSREGNGAYSDDELSMINDPFVKMLGEKARTAKQRKAFAARERQNMYDAVKDMAEKLHLDNVEIVTMSLEMTDRSGKVHHPKGFYNKANDKIIIVIPNHRNIEDALQTLLHEGVAHYGLRQLFGSHFDTFLKNVYEAGDMDVRRRIADLAIRKYQGDFSVATEEYLASLAEDTDFEDMNASWWQKIKHMFLAMLHDLGFDNFAGTHMFTLSDNELRYILWRSYENLKEPGRYRSILGEAEDITMQNHLGVGNYAEDKLERDLRQAYNNLDAAEINYQNYEAKKEEDPFRYNPKTAAIYKESVDFWKDKIAELENKSEPLDTEDEFEKERQEREEDAKISNNSDTNVNNSENVTEPAAWGKKDLMSKAEQVSYGIDPDLLFRDTIDDDDNTARETYNAWADAAITKLREAWQDSMINVKNLQDAVLKQRDEKIEDYENAYNAENRSHGVSRAEAEYFDDVIYKPLLKTVNKTAKEAGVSVGDVTEYMMAKHGLERNRVFAERDANAAWKKYQEQQKAKYDEYAKTHPKGKLTQADFIKKSYDDFFNGYRERDYSGLTALTGTDNVQDAEAEAQRIVADMESRADTSDLWTKTWQATSWTLKKAFDSGIISRDNYDYVSKMFGYYIPLRGWDETTAGDIFDYVGSGAKDTAFSPTLHKAGGRKSQADNPLAYISQMAVSAIVQGNKNKVKQAFFNFVENHPTNLVSVSEMWYRNYGTVTAPDWREDVPYIPENATADEIADIIKKHDEDMEKLKQQGLATKQRGRLHLNVPVKKGQALEHHVEVMLNGKKYIMYINGNPRAAQALNGTRAHRASENSFESSRVANFGRKLAERYTSLSPAFTLSNALRDLTMAAITTLIKEDPKYAIRFRLNVAKLVGPARMFSLMRWYKKLGQSGLNGQNWLSDTQKYFYEFMTQGAETGFTSLKDIEDYKKDMAKEFGNMNQSVINPKRLFRGLKNGLEFANRCIEDMTRFAIYMASRQSGRSIAQSVKDAKNITLNFNRKGSGEMGNSTYRNLQIFINPAIQALQNIVKMAMDHPFKFGGVTGLVALVGVAQPLITQLLAGIFGGGDGDDDDWSPAEEYWKLPTWQRRNNFVFWIPGTKKFGMIPLAQEFRVFHGFGETLSTVLGNHSSENPGLEVLTQAADLLPLDFTGNNGNPLVNVAPTIVQPLLQIGFNTDFTGRPLYKDNDFNKYEPSFQKAYVGTPSWLIKSSQLINEVTGGNDHKQGAWERTKVGQYANNPAVIDHLLKGYYGGLYSFFAQLGGSIMKAASGKTPDVQEVPIVNRVITTPRESQQNGKQQLPDWYFDMVDEAKRTQNELSGYKRDTRDKKEGALNHIEDMTKSEDFKKEMQINALINIVNQIRAAQPSVAEPKNKEEAETKQELDNGLKTVLGKLNTIRTTGKPLTDDDMNDQ